MRILTLGLVLMLVTVVCEINMNVEQLSEDMGKLEQRIEDVDSYVKEWEIGEFEATAYTDGCGNGDGYTATMTKPREGVIAVDPEVIPLNARVYIDGMGWYTAEDTGGAIKENKVDIFMNSLKSALIFGRRDVKIIYRGMIKGGE